MQAMPIAAVPIMMVLILGPWLAAAGAVALAVWLLFRLVVWLEKKS